MTESFTPAGLTKHGGELRLSSHVDQITFENGRAAGVKLRNGTSLRASKAVISNASVWDTASKLLPEEMVPPEYKKAAQQTPTCPSFMHLHIGFDAAGAVFES